jgi:hypothetical protein
MRPYLCPKRSEREIKQPEDNIKMNEDIPLVTVNATILLLFAVTATTCFGSKIIFK